MRVFLTGATGFIGSAIVPELIGAGHRVLGLARSDEGAKFLADAGAEVHRGDLENLESLRAGAANADAVIHTGFIHDFSRFQEVSGVDRRAIETLGAELEGSGRTLIVTSGTAVLPRGPIATEDDPPIPASPQYPRASEETAARFADKGVRVSVVRLPQVHDTVKQGLITFVIQIARKKGASPYVGEGLNRWSAVHRLDAARLYRLALEKAGENARYHAIAEEGIPFRNIAQAIGRGLNVPAVSISPEEAAAHFGFLGMFVGRDLMASGAKTREALGWTPTGPDLLADLENMRYPQA